MKCCGALMKLYKENTVDAAKEKHVPAIEKTSDGIKNESWTSSRSVQREPAFSRIARARSIPTDFPRLMKIVNEHNYHGFFPLETLGEGDPRKKVQALYKLVMDSML